MASISLDLYFLIARMNRTEKAYFSKFGYKYEKDDKPEKTLFEISERLCSSDENIDDKTESEVLKFFNKKHSKTNFSKIKTNLYYDILSALRLYQKSKLSDEKVFEYYHFAQILSQKNMFKEASFLLNKAEKICDENEFYELQLLVLQQKSFVHSRLNFAKNGEESIQQLEKAALINNDLNEILNLQKNYFSLAYMQKEKGIVKEEELIKELDQQESFLLNIDANSTRAKLYRLESLSILATLVGKQQKSFEFYKQIIELLDNNSSIRKNNLFKYLVVYEQYLQMILLSLNTDQFLEKFKLFEAIETTNEQESAWKENAEIFLLSIYGILTNNLNLYENLEIRFNDLLSKSDYLVAGYRKISLAYYMVSGFFMLQQFEKVNDWYNYINNNRNIGIRYDIDVASRIMHILSLLKLKEFEYAETHFKNLKNFYDKNRKFEVEQVVVTILGKLLSETNQDKLALSFTEFENKITTIIKEKPNEAQFIGFFDIISWLKSEIENEDFYKVWRKRNLGA